jgi:hypothetical protein
MLVIKHGENEGRTWYVDISLTKGTMKIFLSRKQVVIITSGMYRVC